MTKFSKPMLGFKRFFKPSSWYSFLTEVPLIAPVIAKHALY